MFLYLATYADVGIAILRAALGVVLVVHGFPKLRNLKQTAVNFGQMGFRPGALFGTIAAFLETFGGLALILGFMTQPVALLFVLEFIVILCWRISKRHPFVSGWELDLLILCGVLFFLAVGAGIYSADASLLWGLY